MHLKKTSLIGLIALALVVWAADIFVPNNLPYGYIAPVTTNSHNVDTGTTVAYAPWFENGTFQGDVNAYNVSTSGVVDLLNPIWSARTKLATQNWSTGRRIVTLKDDGTGVPFNWADGNLSNAQKIELDSANATNTSSPLLDYIRGDDSNELDQGGPYRDRISVLGDIIHSNPTYVGAPRQNYLFDSYLSFAIANKDRAAQVVVGANDGMLHVFDASTGLESFAVVAPSLLGNLSNLTVMPYGHQYFVDGPITSGDVYNGSSWRSIVVSGYGAGGTGYLALDMTTPPTSLASETAIASKVLWEFNKNTTGADDLGYTFGRPSIIRTNTTSNQWMVAVPNGYMNDTGAATLYFLHPATGAVISSITVGTTDINNPNGLSSPTFIDIDGDANSDYAYAGDLEGQVWKFDLTNSDPNNWTGSLFFTATDSGGAGQPITSAPDVAASPDGGVIVYIGTGRLFKNSEASNTQIQSVYGLYDKGSALTSASLTTQTLSEFDHTAGKVRTASSSSVTGDGWKLNLPEGERVLQDIIVRGNRVQFLSSDPGVMTGANWLIEVDYLTGGTPGSTVLDINGDGKLSTADNVDANNDGDVSDPGDVVVGQYQSFGLASRPVLLSTGKGDVAIINHLTAINPAETPPIVVEGPDLGLLGGHFDLDTTDTGGTCTYFACTTQKHEHEWDDKTNRTTIDYFGIVQCSDPLDQSTCTGSDHLDINEAIAANEPFNLIVTNAELSPGAVLSINGSSINVVDYQTTVEEALAGTATLPIFSFDGSGGTTTLTELKMSFNANAIIEGKLIPTETGCMKANAPGKYDEIRSGSLTMQAVRAADFPAEVNDMTPGPMALSQGKFEAPRQGKGTGAVKHKSGGNPAMLWEALVFWHWDGSCYGTSSWDSMYEDCITNGNIENCIAEGSGDGTGTGSTCTPGKHKWKIEFTENFDWAQVGDMTIKIIAYHEGGDTVTSSITFNESNINDVTISDVVIEGDPGFYLNMSSAAVKKKNLENLYIENVTDVAKIITGMQVSWTGSFNADIKKVKDDTKGFKVDPLSSAAAGNVPEGSVVDLGYFVLEPISAEACYQSEEADNVSEPPTDLPLPAADDDGSGSDDDDGDVDGSDPDTDVDSNPVATGVEADPGASITNTQQAGPKGAVGRLKWKEIRFD